MNKKTIDILFDFLHRKETEGLLFSGLFFFKMSDRLPFYQSAIFTFSDDPQDRILQMVALLAVVLSISFINSLFRNIVRIIRQDRAANQKKKSLENKTKEEDKTKEK